MRNVFLHSDAALGSNTWPLRMVSKVRLRYLIRDSIAPRCHIMLACKENEDNSRKPVGAKWNISLSRFA